MILGMLFSTIPSMVVSLLSYLAVALIVASYLPLSSVSPSVIFIPLCLATLFALTLFTGSDNMGFKNAFNNSLVNGSLDLPLISPL